MNDPVHIQEDSPQRAEIEGSSRSGALLLLPIMAAGLLLRLYGIGERGFWWDEIALWRESLTLTFESHSAVLPGLVAAALMRATNSYGSFVFHLPSVLFGTLAIGAAWLLAKELVDSRTALAAATLTAISPMAIYYSQEGRPYGLLQLLATMMIYTFVRAARGCSIERWSQFTIAAILCGHTHLLGSHVLVAITAAFAVSLGLELREHRRITEPKRILCLGVAMITSSGLGYTWPLFRDSVARVFEGRYTLGLGEFVRVATGALAAGLPIELTEHGRLASIGLPIVLLAIFGTRVLLKRNPASALSILFTILTTTVTLYFTLGVKGTWPWLRYLSHVWIPAIVLIAAGWRHLPWSKNRIASLVSFVLLCGVFLPGLMWWKAQATGLRSEPYRLMALEIHEKEQTLAGIIYPQHRYLYGNETLRNVDLYRLHRMDRLPEYVVGSGITTIEDVPARVGGAPLPVRGTPVYRIPRGRYAIVSRTGLNYVDLQRAYPITLDELLDLNVVHY